MSPQRSRHELPDEEIDDASSELFDLPAAVVCARCGRADCAGCDGDEPEAAPSASGVVLVVPWERPEQPLWSRFWATTRLGVDGAEVFFSSLPDGPVGPALSYAALAELVAVGACVLGFAALALGALGALVPVFTRSLLTEPWGQAVLGRVLTAAWGSFAALLVGVHALHGWALHRGASSPRSPRRRALAAVVVGPRRRPQPGRPDVPRRQPGHPRHAARLLPARRRPRRAPAPPRHDPVGRRRAGGPGPLRRRHLRRRLTRGCWRASFTCGRELLASRTGPPVLARLDRFAGAPKLPVPGFRGTYTCSNKPHAAWVGLGWPGGCGSMELR